MKEILRLLSPLLTTDQVATYLGVSTKKICELCAQRKLGYVVIGKKTRRFTEDMVRHYIDTQSRVFDENGRIIKIQPRRKSDTESTDALKNVDGTPVKLLSCKKEEEQSQKNGDKKTAKQLRKEFRALCR